ncbi:MAG TPA: hypothetical protein VH275_03370 [Solirubrobacterales bacterium]|jgi:hypothetical protein|nr:hypothetical protein [Solirubrobacterales bacterium]
MPASSPTTRQPRRTAKILRGPLRHGLALLALALSALAFALPASASADVGICSAGTGAGKCENAQGLAVDSETGRLYVADAGNNRVDVFEDGPEHTFAFAFGWGVANGASELQSCGPQATPPTANCLKGLASGGAGAFNGTANVFSGAMTDIAVDNDPTSPSQHDVYVLDGRRVQKFDPQGNFLLTFGGGVISGGASGTGNLAAGSNEIKAVQTTSKQFATGQTITGAGIPAATRITALGAETITLSKAATAAGTGVALSVATGAGNKPANEVDRLINKGLATASPNFFFNTPIPNPPPNRTELGQLPNSTTCPQLQAAFEGLSNVGPGNVACIGEKVEGELHEYTVEFKGTRYSDTDVTLEDGPGTGNRKVVTVENGGAAAEACTAAIAVSCSAGVPGDGEGQIAESAHLAVGPGGAVYVVDCVREDRSDSCENRLQKFEPSGTFIEELDLAQTGNEPHGIAVNSADDFYISFNQAVLKYDPTGNLLKELTPVAGTGALSIDSAGHLFAADAEAGRLLIAEYDATDNIVRRFGYDVLKSKSSGLAHFPLAGNDIYSAEGGSVFYRSFPAPGLVIAAKPCRTSFLGNAKATLLAEVNPEGKATTVHFEYISDADFIANGNNFSGAQPAKETAESESIGSDFKLHNAEAQAALVPETKYHCRVVATNADAPGGLTGEEGTFTSKAPLELGVTYVSGVGSETATLNATVNPLTISASGFFEYVEEATYLKDIEELGSGHGFDHAAKAPDVDGGEEAIDFESGEIPKLGSAQVSGLKPATSYRFRIVATDVLIAPEGKAFAGPSKGFRTFGSGAGALPDNRGYELVSPSQKNSAEVAVPGNSTGFLEPRFTRIVAGSTSGEAVTYTSWTSFGKAEGSQATGQYLSKRTPSGWTTENISPFGFLTLPLLPPYGGFSPDLRFGAFKTTEPVLTSDCRKGLESLYLRDNETGELHCLSPDTPGAPKSPCFVYAGVSEGGTRAFLAGAPEGGEEFTYSLYEWSAANGIQPISVLPNGEPAPATDNTAFGPGGTLDFAGGIEACQNTRTVLRHAISADGSRVFWTYVPEASVTTAPAGPGIQSLAVVGAGSGTFALTFKAQTTPVIAFDANAGVIQKALESLSTIGAGNVEVTGSGPFTVTFKGALAGTSDQLSVTEAVLKKAASQLLARVNGTETVQLDLKQPSEAAAGNGVFRAASADGSVVYFTDSEKLISGAKAEEGKPDLYRYQLGVSKPLTDLTKGTVPGDVRGVVGASDDGSYVYFVAGAVLSEAPNSAGQVAEAGKNNLYLSHEGQTSFIASLASEDSRDWTATPRDLRSRVSPDGRHLAFLSIEAQKLAGYDNTIAAGEHCQYEEPTNDGKLLVGSLTGSPLCPQAFLYTADDGKLSCASCNPSGSRPLGPSVVPGWSNGFEGPRFLSDNGQRLFFQSFDAILQADENGKGDIYEFERPGSGSCSAADNDFDPTAGGCHYLVSSGKSEDESYLVDASADGRDVFFSTRERLVGWDENDNYDVYDLRAGGGFPEPPPAPPVCQGEACKASSPPVPPANPAPASANFQGPGNLSKPTSSRCPKGKVRRKARCVKSRHKSQRQKQGHRRAGVKRRAGR